MKTRIERLVDLVYYGVIIFSAGLICGYAWAYIALMT
jgi:hypothetical protein